jgi:hypothetical protein
VGSPCRVAPSAATLSAPTGEIAEIAEIARIAAGLHVEAECGRPPRRDRTGDIIVDRGFSSTAPESNEHRGNGNAGDSRGPRALGRCLAVRIEFAE